MREKHVILIFMSLACLYNMTISSFYFFLNDMHSFFSMMSLLPIYYFFIYVSILSIF